MFFNYLFCILFKRQRLTFDTNNAPKLYKKISTAKLHVDIVCVLVVWRKCSILQTLQKVHSFVTKVADYFSPSVMV